jgi:hypothetical protein
VGRPRIAPDGRRQPKKRDWIMFARTKRRKAAEAAHEVAHRESAKHLQEAVRDSKASGLAHVGSRWPVQRDGSRSSSGAGM